MKDNPEEMIEYLSDFITPRRLELFTEILQWRTRYLTVVLEDIFQPQNASAVLRTCECFGIHDVHIIENRNPYRVNPDVVIGATKWLNVVKYQGKEYNTLEAMHNLKNSGYRIVATSLNEKATRLEDFDMGKGKTALFFGTELTGLTDPVFEQADECLKIPMFGFTESFNLSVCASIILHHLTNVLHGSEIRWMLTKEEKNEVMLQWLKKSIKHSGKLKKKFRDNQELI